MRTTQLCKTLPGLTAHIGIPTKQGQGSAYAQAQPGQKSKQPLCGSSLDKNRLTASAMAT